MALKLKADATFFTDVRVPVPGDKAEVFKAEFVHMTRKGLDEFMEGRNLVNDADTVMQIVKSWDIKDIPFTKENVEQLNQQYHAFMRSICTTFIDQLMQARVGN